MKMGNEIFENGRRCEILTGQRAKYQMIVGKS
jgi:hypothetical protein